MSQPNALSPKRSRGRWHQYSLRTLLGLVTLAVGMLVAWRAYVGPYHRQRQTMRLIERLGGTYETVEAPKWLRLYGDDFQNISLVNLADCDQPDEYVGPIAALPALETLVVGGLQFSDDHLRQLEGLATLDDLVLDSTSVASNSLDQWKQRAAAASVYLSQRRAIREFLRHETDMDGQRSEKHPALSARLGREFFVEVTSISLEGGSPRDLLPYLKCLHTVRALALSGDVPSAWKDLGNFVDLESLSIYQAELDAATIAAIGNCTSLRKLRVWKTQLAAADVRCLLARLDQLADLSLHRIDDAALQHLSHLAELEYLDLQDNSITDDGLAHIATLNGLKRLDLSSTSITDAGLVHLSRLANLTSLRLANTRVNGAGFKHLKPLINLETLDAWCAPVNDEAMPYMQGLASLHELILGGTNVTDQGIAKLGQLIQERRVPPLRLRGKPTKASDDAMMEFNLIAIRRRRALERAAMPEKKQ
jgi:hypothetical protein